MSTETAQIDAVVLLKPRRFLDIRISPGNQNSILKYLWSKTGNHICSFHEKMGVNIL